MVAVPAIPLTKNVTSGDQPLDLLHFCYTRRLNAEHRCKALEQGAHLDGTPGLWQALAAYHDLDVARRLWNAYTARLVLQTHTGHVLTPLTEPEAVQQARLASCSLRRTTYTPGVSTE